MHPLADDANVTHLAHLPWFPPVLEYLGAKGDIMELQKIAGTLGIYARAWTGGCADAREREELSIRKVLRVA